MDDVVLRFTVRKDMKLALPVAETPTHYIIMAYNPDLNEAAKDATRAAIAFCRRQRDSPPSMPTRSSVSAATWRLRRSWTATRVCTS